MMDSNCSFLKNHSNTLTGNEEDCYLSSLGESSSRPPSTHLPPLTNTYSVTNAPPTPPPSEIVVRPSRATVPYIPSSWSDLILCLTRHTQSFTAAPFIAKLPEYLYKDFIAALDDRRSIFRLVRYRFTASTGILSVRMPGAVHDSLEPFINRGIRAFCRTHRLTAAEEGLFDVSAAQDTNAFVGPYSGSCKRPDLLITPCDYYDSDDSDAPNLQASAEILNQRFPSVVAEVGFSEGYNDLCEDMRLWLLGSAGLTRVVILVVITEYPKFDGRPFRRALPPPLLAPADTVPNPRKVQVDTYGPVTYDGHILVGAIKARLELWRINPDDEKPYCTCSRSVIPPDPEDDTMRLTAADIFGGEGRVIPRIDPAEEVVFKFKIYRTKLVAGISKMADQRLTAANKRRVEEEAKAQVGDDGEWVEEE